MQTAGAYVYDPNSGKRVLDPNYNFIAPTYHDAVDKDYQLIKEIQVGWTTLFITVVLVILTAMFGMLGNEYIVAVLAGIVVVFAVLALFLKRQTVAGLMTL
jgi:hypothetical protein